MRSAVEDRLSDSGKEQGFPWWSGGATSGTGPGREREASQEPGEEVLGLSAVKSASRGAAIRTVHGIVVQDRQGVQLPRREVM